MTKNQGVILPFYCSISSFNSRKNMWYQKEIILGPKERGFHLVTEELVRQLPELKSLSIGIMQVFIKHTSASLTINENADPTVRGDFERFFNHAVAENEPYYQHLDEGSDDMPAHLKSSILGSSVSIPLTNGKLNMGIWQGIYLCEHRNYGGARTVVVTLQGDAGSQDPR
jgi:secondary thiamine-phosphate synthase enzyme